MSDRITQLQDQGYSLSHASMIATVEWAIEDWGRGGWWCAACGGGDPPVHQGDCPIPALGYAVLHEQHWYERRWDWTQRKLDMGKRRCWMPLGSQELGEGRDYQIAPPYCRLPRGHDDGAHEPEREL